MFKETTFNLIGETLICLDRKRSAPLVGRSKGRMGVFPLGEMKNAKSISTGW
ncbi:MAG: hypothetical protein FD170_3376 [Bacteroidetes bacterium]|nr:MAG: hypothetical protein FD170_3376 [Bacteroidota bacterium]